MTRRKPHTVEDRREIDIVERLRFDSARCEMQFSKGVAGNIEEAADEIERLRKALHKITEQDYDAGYTAETFAEAVLSDWPGILSDDEQSVTSSEGDKARDDGGPPPPLPAVDPQAVPAGPLIHDSDCAIHNGPAMAAGPCDCRGRDKS